MTEAGVVDAIASFFITVSQDNLFALYSLVVLGVRVLFGVH
jgi:hypothetical protein